MPTTSTVDPSPIVAIASGFMAAKQLFAASEVGLFAALADGPQTIEVIAERAGIPERTARILADSMVGLGLVSYTDGSYTNAEAAQQYLSGTGDGLDLRAYLAFWNQISYPHWLPFTDTMRTGEPNPFDMNAPEVQGTFMGGVMTYNALHALMLADNYDFTNHSKAIDLGGLSVDFLGEAAKRNPDLHGTFVAAGPMLEMARSGADDSYAGQLTFHEGDALTDEIPGTYDLVLLEHVIHRFDADDNKKYLRRAREIVEPGGRVIVVDFMLDASDGRRLDPLLAGEYLNIDGTVVYPESEVKQWLADTGWKWTETRELPGSPRALIGEPA